MEGVSPIVFRNVHSRLDAFTLTNFNNYWSKLRHVSSGKKSEASIISQSLLGSSLGTVKFHLGNGVTNQCEIWLPLGFFSFLSKNNNNNSLSKVPMLVFYAACQIFADSTPG